MIDHKGKKRTKRREGPCRSPRVLAAGRVHPFSLRSTPRKKHFQDSTTILTFVLKEIEKITQLSSRLEAHSRSSYLVNLHQCFSRSKPSSLSEVCQYTRCPVGNLVVQGSIHARAVLRTPPHQPSSPL